MSIKKVLVLVGTLIIAAVILAACGGTPTEAPEMPEVTEVTEAPEMIETPEAIEEVAMQDVSVQPETCGICHKDAGEKHQASYDELYQDGVIQVSNLTYRFTEPGTTVVTFKMTKNGAPYNGGAVQNLNIYFAAYTGTAFEGAGRLALKGKLSYDPASGVTTSTLVELDPADANYIDYTNISGVDGHHRRVRL